MEREMNFLRLLIWIRRLILLHFSFVSSLFFRHGSLGRGKFRGELQGLDVRREDRNFAVLQSRTRLQIVESIQSGLIEAMIY